MTQDVEVAQLGATIIFDTGHSIKVHGDAEHVTTLISNAGYAKNEFVYVYPWWMIDDKDQVAVKVDRVVAVRNIRDTVVVDA